MPQTNVLVRCWLLSTLLGLGCGGEPAVGGPDAGPRVDGAPGASPYPADLVDLVARSGWVLRATVTQLHAATEDPPPPFADPDGLWDLDKMVVVRIDQVSVEPLEYELPPGTSDTVILRAPPEPDIAVGSELYVFVTWLSAGDSWVFVEEGHMEAGLVDFDHFHSKVHEVKRYLLDRAVYDRMAGAERVIRGTVVEVEDLPDPISDNLPDWWVATVQPRDTLRGAVEIDPVAVRFQGGANPCCVEMPRLEPGREQIMFLYPDDVTGFPDPASIVIDPLDVQPPPQLELLRSLLASPPEPPEL